MKKRIFALVLALCIVLTMVPAAFAAGYHDTDDHWAEEAIARWSEHGIVEGNDGWFFPGGVLNRGQLAAIIARLLKLPAAPDAGFGDTDGHWAEDVINRCAAAGIMKGDGVNANPDKPISREETMVMLGRALGIKPVEDADLSHYEDDHAVSDWAEGYVAAMTGAGIVNGIDGNLAPDAEIDRASTMTILDRAITTYVTEPGTTVESTGGIVLVAAEDVTVTGEAEAVVVTQGAAGGTTTLDNAKVGTVTVQAEESAVVMGEETVVVEVEVTETAAGAAVEVTKDATVGTVTTAAAESTVSVSGTVQNVDVAENATAAAVTVEKNAEVGTVTTAAAESTVAVSGTVTNVTVSDTATGATVEASKGAAIENVTTEAENTTVTGNGTVENVTTSGNNTTVETGGTKVEAAEGTTGTTAGDKVVEGGESATTTPTTPSTPSVSEHYCSYTAVVTAPTCTEKGYTTYTCRCGDSYVDDEVPELGHDFTGAWKSDETGHWHECANGCGETDTKAAHGWLSNNCAEATECGTCGYDKAAGEHTWDAGEVTTAPTCTEKGEKTFTCTADKCDATKTEPVAETGHSYTNYVSNGDATCEADGTKTAKCDNGCGTEDTMADEGSKLGHKYTYTSNKNGTHTYVCGNDEKHTGTEDCDAATCTKCGQAFEAKIGSKYYVTLQEALNVGGEVTLLKDIVLTEPAVVPEGKNVTLNLNGKTIDAGWADENAGKHIYAIDNKGTLTITGNGVINARGNFNYGTLTIENGVTVNACDTNGGAGVWAYENSETVINGGTFTAAEAAGCVNSAGKLTINGGTFTQTQKSGAWCYAVNFSGTEGVIKNATVNGAHGCVAVTKGVMTIDSGSFTATGVDSQTDHVLYNNGGEVIVNGGTFTGDHKSGGVCVYDKSKNSVISGGTFSDDPSAYVAEGYEAKKNDNGTYTVEEFKLDSEEELVAAIAKGGEVTLDGDIELTKALTVAADNTVVLDLNGKTITYNSTTQGEAMITNKGTLTINDSSDPDAGVINYNYTGAADDSHSKGNYTIDNGGTLTVNGGKITIADLRVHAKYPINNNSTAGNAILTINGGHLYNYNTSAIRQFCNSTTNKNSVTITGGLIEGYNAIWMQNPGSKTVNGSLNITGGEIRTTAAAYVNNTSVLKDVASRIYCTIVGEGGAWDTVSAVSITGGTINENVSLAENAPAKITTTGNAVFNGYVKVPAEEAVAAE